MYHKTWNPWIYENGGLRRTAETTFYRPLKYKQPIRILVGTEADFFDPNIPYSWRKDAAEIIVQKPNITFLIPSEHPDPTCSFTNAWIGLKITDHTNLKPLLKSIEHLPFVKRWVFFDGLTKEKDITALFKCDSPIHFNESKWHHAYPCSTCTGDGYLNKYLIQWIVVSGSNVKYIPTDVVRGICNYAEALKIPFYYKQALIGGKLIRDPYLDEVQYTQIP